MPADKNVPLPPFFGGRGHIKYHWTELQEPGDSKFWPVPEGKDPNLFRNVLRRSAQSRKEPFEINTRTEILNGVTGIRTWRK